MASSTSVGGDTDWGSATPKGGGKSGTIPPPSASATSAVSSVSSVLREATARKAASKFGEGGPASIASSEAGASSLPTNWSAVS